MADLASDADATLPPLADDRSAKTPTESTATIPDDPDATFAGNDPDQADDGERTWVPGGDESLDDCWFSDGAPCSSTTQPSAEKTLESPDDPDATYAGPSEDSGATYAGRSEDPDATHAPTGSHSVQDVWGYSFDPDDGSQTLKRLDETGFSTPTPDVELDQNAPPDLSAKGYDVLSVLGEGGVGVVYQAVQKSVNRKIALKMIKAAVGGDTREKEQFIAEAVVTGRLDHPNIVPIHDLDTTPDGQPFYTMKMVRGTPWGDVVHDKPLAENLSILLAVCDAVSFAHSRSVIHRDLKPDNVMLGEFGEVQLMDWGLGASVVDDGKRVDLPQSQAAGGTPAFMAPEMVTGEDGPVGVHSDIYLLGTILYQVITGNPPHGGKRVLNVLQNARDNVIEPTERDGPLVDIALKAMQTDPADRHAGVNELKRALLDYQDHAESIKLCDHAFDDLRRARESQDYEAFAEALFGFRQARERWDGNTRAEELITEAQGQYAQCAFSKGDLDLAGSTLDRDCDEHEDLKNEIQGALRKRDVARRRLKLFRVTALGMTVAVMVILTVSSIWIYAAKRQADVAKEQAVVAKEEALVSKEEALASKEAAVKAHGAEAEQRKLAEGAMTKAQEEEARAVKALAELEQAYTDLVEAQEQEKRAWAQAKASDLVATETRDELAKSGMLLDNTWWVFDGAAARKAQAEAAQAIDLPTELVIKLSDDVDLVMVLVPPGDFVMGSPPVEESRSADEHLHRVRHSHAFYVGKFELTEKQWLATTGAPPPSVVDREVVPGLPVIGVSYEQITRDLLPALQKHSPDGYEFRLPTEAEWEYACRAGTGTAYHTGDGEKAIDAAGWFLTNSTHNVQQVGQKTPNSFGLFDMHGNASEVCADQYDIAFYLGSAVDDPLSAVEGDSPVVRGGSVLNTAQHCRSAYRSYVYQKNEYPFLGLRLALAPVRESTTPKVKDKQTEDSPQP